MERVRHIDQVMINDGDRGFRSGLGQHLVVILFPGGGGTSHDHKDQFPALVVALQRIQVSDQPVIL